MVLSKFQPLHIFILISGKWGAVRCAGLNLADSCADCGNQKNTCDEDCCWNPHDNTCLITRDTTNITKTELTTPGGEYVCE